MVFSDIQTLQNLKSFFILKIIFNIVKTICNAFYPKNNFSMLIWNISKWAVIHRVGSLDITFLKSNSSMQKCLYRFWIFKSNKNYVFHSILLDHSFQSRYVDEAIRNDDHKHVYRKSWKNLHYKTHYLDIFLIYNTIWFSIYFWDSLCIYWRQFSYPNHASKDTGKTWSLHFLV